MTGWQVSQCPLQSEWNAFFIFFFPAAHTLRHHAVRGLTELSHGRSGGPPLFHQFRGGKKLLHNRFSLREGFQWHELQLPWFIQKGLFRPAK